jgi:hypothetical protein
MGIIERGCIGKRFDWFVNRSEGKIKEERLNNLKKFFIWISLTILCFNMLPI